MWAFRWQAPLFCVIICLVVLTINVTPERPTRLRDAIVQPEESILCPLCARSCDPQVFRFHTLVEPHITSILHRRHPAWHPTEGANPALTPARGSYPYKFLVDQSRWTRDPENPAVVEDGCGGYHSLLMIGA